jgi:competence protein ComEC
MKVLQFPLTRITIGFVFGLLFAKFMLPPIEVVLIIISFTLISFFVLYFYIRSAVSACFGIIIYFLSFLLGISNAIVHTDHFKEKNYIHNKTIFEKPHDINITIIEKLKKSTFNDRYIATVNRINDKAQSGKLLLNISKDSIERNLTIGSILIIKGVLTKNKQPSNPHQFDYSKYLENKQIYAQLYTDTEDIKIGSEIKKDIWYYSSFLRSRIINNLENNNFNKTELHVAVALIMGQQQEISPEIIRDYQYAGAVHILSVSGLHIGFILLFVTFLLKPLPNTRRGSFLKLIIIISSLSLFGIIAGLAPSVVRSVTMFSFVAIGIHLRRSVNIYHTILVSVFLILLVEPSFLFDVGFQLSYLALFFIIWLQPVLASIYTPKNKLSRYFWDILTVSFAAQIGTLPLSIYYFHQFPALFFVTNLIIIPMLSIIMVLGVIVMILAAFNSTPVFASRILEWSIYFMNKIINIIASFEQFIIKDIPLHFYLLVSSYIMLFTAIIWLKKPNFNQLVCVLISIIILQISFLTITWNTESEQELVFFNSNKSTLIAERNGNNVNVIANDSILRSIDKNSLIKSYCLGTLSSVSKKTILNNFLFFKGKTIYVLDSNAIYPKGINADILVLTQSSKVNLDRVLLTMQPKIVVADKSNFRNLNKRWKESCAKNKIPFHATAEKGYYIIK